MAAYAACRVTPRGMPTVYHPRAKTSSVHRLAHPHLLHSRKLYVPLHAAASPVRRPCLHQRGVLGCGIAPHLILPTNARTLPLCLLPRLRLTIPATRLRI